MTLVSFPKRQQLTLPDTMSFGGRSLAENIARADAAVAKMAYTERIFDRSRSQWMLKHLTCSNAHPWLRMRQISSEMQNRRMALDEAKHGYMKAVVCAKMARRKASECNDSLRQEMLLISASEQDARANNILVKIEGALKEISALEAMHDTLKEQIGEITEANFEAAQVKSHLSRVFMQAARDVRATGRIGVGNQEYFEQIGVSIAAAEEDVIAYVNAERTEKPKDTRMLHDWLRAMASKYHDVARQQAAWLGFDEEPDASLMFEPT